MKRKIMALWLTVSMLVLGAPPAAGQDEAAFTVKSRQTQDYFSTVCALFLYDDYTLPENAARFEQTWRDVKALLAEIEQDTSLSVPTSDIVRFNALSDGESTTVSAHTAAILTTAKRVYDETGGLYDPTVYPLVDLWGFSPRFNRNDYTVKYAYDRAYQDGRLPLPDTKYVRAFQRLVNLGGVELSGDAQNGYRLTKRIPPVVVDGIAYQAQLDFGGIAKGYAADCVTELLRARGYAYGYFVSGGSSISVLKCASASARENGTWAYSLGIKRPRAGRSQDRDFVKVAIRDTTLSSSGDYSHNYIHDHTLYCHTIDPRTGYPINMPVDGKQTGIAALTLLGDGAMYNDAMSTALLVMGGRAAIAYINQNLRSHDVIMTLYQSGNDVYEVVTNMQPSDYTITDDAYVCASESDAQGNIIYRGTLLCADRPQHPVE